MNTNNHKAIQVLQDNYQVILDKWVNHVIEVGYTPVPEHYYYEMGGAFIKNLVVYMESKAEQGFSDIAAAITSGELTKLVRVDQALHTLNLLKVVVQRDFLHFFQEGMEDPAFNILMTTIDQANVVFTRTYAQHREDYIQKQHQAILELSTPVIQVWDKIIVLPLIGTVDSIRAQKIIENLLEAIMEHHAQIAILDITGVPLVDTQIANHIITTVKAAKLLGSNVIITGIGPYIAQTMVKLGVNLEHLVTRSTLRSGLELAFEMLDYSIVKE